MASFPFILGLTGGIGSGKSTVSTAFEHLGVTVVDADIVAREVVALGEPLLDTLATTFGQDILLADGTLNRAALRQLVFSDRQKKEQLNALMHPAIRTRLFTQLQQAQSSYVILSAPLLFENQLDAYCDRVLLVDLPEPLQIERTLQRDQVSLEQVQAIMQAQWSRTQRRAKADDIFDNSLPLASITERVATLHQHYLHLARAKQPLQSAP